MESPAAVNDDFNLSTAASTTVLELAEAIWHKIHTDGRPFRYVSDAAVRARRPAPRAGRPQGARGPRLRGDDDPRPDARRGHPVDPGGSGGRTTLMRRAGAVGRHARLQGGRGGRAGPPGADRGDRRRRTRSSSSTTSTRTRPCRSSSGSPPSCRRSAGSATTSVGACSTR